MSIEERIKRRAEAKVSDLPDSAPKTMEPPSFANPGELPPEVMEFERGIIPQVMDYALRTAPRPNRPLSFAGAVAFCAHICGRRYRAEDGTRPNVYLTALADSGCGKDQPRKVNRELAFAVGMVGSVCDSFGSGSGLEDALLADDDSGKILFQLDEIDHLFRKMKADREASTEDISRMMLTIWGDAASTHSRRKLSKAKPEESKMHRFVTRPALSIFGTAIPAMFFDAMSQRMMTNGLFARMVLIPAGGRPDLQNVRWAPIPPALAADLRDFAHARQAEDGKWEAPKIAIEAIPNEYVVPFTDEARTMVGDLAAEYDERWKIFERDEAAKALLSRSVEKIIKFALVFAVSSDWREPTITVGDLKRAKALVDYSNNKSLYLAAKFCSEGEFHELCQKLKRKLEDGKRRRADLLRGMHQPAKVFQEVIDTLVESGEIYCVNETVKNPYYDLVDFNAKGTKK